MPGLGARAISTVTAFNSMLDDLVAVRESGADVGALVQAVLELSGLLAAFANSDDPQDATRAENLAELESVAVEFHRDALAALEVDGGGRRPGTNEAPEAPDPVAAGAPTRPISTPSWSESRWCRMRTRFPMPRAVSSP